jgi:sugar phosphate isomerase/epimerase
MVCNSDNLYISTTFAVDHSRVTEVLKLCHERNITNIELGSNHCFEEGLLENIINCDFNYLIHNYFPVPKHGLVINIASLDEGIYHRSMQQIKDSIKFAAQIEAKLFTFHPGFLVDPVSTNTQDDNYDFIFDSNDFKNINYEKSFLTLVNALSEILNFAQIHDVEIAIETEGSRETHLAFMYHPKEYERLFKLIDSKLLGINLNLGHLHLASKELNFNKEEFIQTVEKNIVAIEMSHNNGVEDEHLPLKKDQWYWKLIFDDRFNDAYKIMEYRNKTIVEIEDNIHLFNEIDRKFHS